jgi:hypothetical protein
MSVKSLWWVILLFLAVFAVGCGKDDGGTNGPPPPAMIRVLVQAHQDPTLVDAVHAAVWDSITAVKIPVGTENAYNADMLFRTDLFADMKALIADDSLLYIWVKWNDITEDNRFGELRASWVNSKIQWVVNPEDTVYRNEDRFSILFNNGGTNGADCSKFCHAAADSSSAGKRFYGAAGDDADVWHWKAHRTGLARLADDMHITSINVSPDPQGVQMIDSLYFVNFTVINPADSSHVRPIYMHPDSTAYTGAGLLESETDAGYFTAYVPTMPWVIFFPDQDPVGRTIPGYYIYDESGTHGSRWNVRAVSEFDGDYWTVVFRRRLTTDDPADIDLAAIVDSLQISFAIGNNAGSKHHGRKPFYLIFQ